MRWSATTRLAAFAAVLAIVFGAAWLVGDLIGPAPSADHAGQGMEDHA